MYNPENLVLPTDPDDPSLIRYFWRYDLVKTVAIGSDDPVDEIYFDVGRVSATTSAFHLMTSAEVNHLPEYVKSYKIEELDPAAKGFEQARDEIHAALGYSAQDKWKPPVGSWSQEGYEYVTVMRLRNNFKWEIRGFQGLTLEAAESELFGADGFQFEWEPYWSYEGEMLEENEVDIKFERKSLRFADPEYGARQLMGAQLEVLDFESAKEAATYLYEFDGPELAKFHFPYLTVCDQCWTDAPSFHRLEEPECADCAREDAVF